MVKKFFKSLSLILAGIMAFNIPAYADVAINTDASGNSEKYIDYEEHIYSGEIISGSEETNVYAIIGSQYKVTIPKTIVLSGVTKQAGYYVDVEGDIAGYEILHVVPDETVDLYSKNKDMQTGNIVQDKTAWRFNEMNINAAGTVSADSITAGKWSGTFNFTIWIETIDEERVLGDIVLPEDLTDDYRLIIKKIHKKPGVYDRNGILIEDINILVDGHGFDPSKNDGSPSNIINTYCPGATYIVLPEGTTSIGAGAFSGTNVVYVEIPESVTTIGPNAFSPSTVYVNIPGSVTRIGSGSTPAGKSYYKNKPIRRITVDIEKDDEIILEKGYRYEITALYNFINDVTNESTIVSSNPNIVRFVPDCYLDALEIGRCTISGTYYTSDGRQKYAEIKVRVVNGDDYYSGYQNGDSINVVDVIRLPAADKWDDTVLEFNVYNTDKPIKVFIGDLDISELPDNYGLDCSSSNNDIAMLSWNNGKVYTNNVGETNINIFYWDTVLQKDCTFKLNVIDTPSSLKLQSMSFADIQAMAKAGKTASYGIKVGDTIKINDSINAKITEIGNDYIEFITTNKVISNNRPNTLTKLSTGQTVTSCGPAAFYKYPQVNNGKTNVATVGYNGSSLQSEINAWFNAQSNEFKAVIKDTTKVYETATLTYNGNYSQTAANGTVEVLEKVYIPSKTDLEGRLKDCSILQTSWFWTSTPASFTASSSYIDHQKTFSRFYNGGYGYIGGTDGYDGCGAVILFRIG